MIAWIFRLIAESMDVGMGGTSECPEHRLPFRQ
jgi:hypothetical protein